MSPRPIDVVRVRNIDTGDHYTTTRYLAGRRGDEVLPHRPAVDDTGRWLDPKPHENLTPVRDDHGRFATGGIVGGDPAVGWQAFPLGDHNGVETPTDEPTTGEEES